MTGEGRRELEALRTGGFSEQEVSEYRNDISRQLLDGGFTQEEVDDYFGKKPFQDQRVADMVRQPEPAPEGENREGTPEGGPQVREATSFLEAVESGYDISVTGLVQGRPDVVLPENAGMFYRIASQVGTLAGDIPAMVAGATAGGLAGGTAGTATLPVVGTVSGAAVGAGAGAFAVPEAIRTAYLEAYENGEVDDFEEFWERTSAITINALKGGTIGAVTTGVGGILAGLLGKAAVPAIAKSSTVVAGEVATMTTVGAALEGEVPKPEHFLDAAILIGGLKGSGYVSSRVNGKLRDIYKRRGTKPEEVATEAQNDIKTRQEMVSENNIPGERVERVESTEAITTAEPLKTKTAPEVTSEATQTILSKVSEAQSAAKELPSFNEFYRQTVDRLDPIKQAVAELNQGKPELSADNNPYILSRMTVDHKAKAKHAFEKGTLDFKTLATNGKSLKQILEGVENPEVLDAYMISKRVVEKTGQGKKTGFDVEAAKAVVKEHKAKYEQAAKEVTEYSNRVLDYVADSGVLSREAVARMKKENQDYVPFKRIFEPTGKVGEKTGGGKAGSLKEFRGSYRDIQSPLQSITENTIELYRMAETNRPVVKLVELAEKLPEQELIVRKKAPVIQVKVSEDAVLKQLQSQGVAVEAAAPVAAYARAQKQLAPNEFQVYRDGKRQVFQTKPELAEAIRSLDGDGTSMNLIMRMMNGVTTFKKFGITFTPDFILRNFQRDYVTGTVFSKAKLSPVDVFSSMGDIIQKNDTYFNWLKSGGANGAFLELGERYVKQDIAKLQRDTSFLSSARNLVEKPIDAMRVGAELAEQSLRLAEFKQVSKKGDGITGLVEGGFASREITLDFQRVGAKVSALNSITAFLNVSIQGLDKTGRAFIEKPGQTSLRAAAAITTPSILLWWANKDDQRVQDIPRWERDLFWIVPTDNWTEATPGEANGLPEYMVQTRGEKTFINKGTIYRIPKPMELGVIFGSLPERVLDAYFTENPGALKDFEKTIGDLITPSVVPDAVSPVIEQYFNKSFFTGNDIVPHHMEGILPKYQAKEYTSETAKTIGRLVSGVNDQSTFASPLILDNYIQSWGGSLGRYAVQLTDQILRGAGVAPDIAKPEDTLADVPFVKSFVVRFPRSSAKPVTDFYDNYRDFKQIQSTIDFLQREGNVEALEQELTLQENQSKLVSLDGIRDALGNLSTTIRNVNKDPDMSPEEKRQLIDGLYLMMNETARSGNELVEEIKKQMEQ